MTVITKCSLITSGISFKFDYSRDNFSKVSDILYAFGSVHCFPIGSPQLVLLWFKASLLVLYIPSTRATDFLWGSNLVILLAFSTSGLHLTP